jgi:hypothetical protein
MCSLTIEWVVLLQNVFSYYRMCSLTTECVLLLQNVFSYCCLWAVLHLSSLKMLLHLSISGRLPVAGHGRFDNHPLCQPKCVSMCSLTVECVLLLYNRMCSLTVECVLLLYYRMCSLTTERVAESACARESDKESERVCERERQREWARVRERATKRVSVLCVANMSTSLHHTSCVLLL